MMYVESVEKGKGGSRGEGLGDRTLEKRKKSTNASIPDRFPVSIRYRRARLDLPQPLSPLLERDNKHKKGRNGKFLLTGSS